MTRGRYPVLARGDVTPMIFDFKITAVFKPICKQPSKIGAKFDIELDPSIFSEGAKSSNSCRFGIRVTKISIYGGGVRP